MSGAGSDGNGWPDAAIDCTTESGGAPAVAVTGLTKVYGSGDDAVRALDDVSFSVESGTVVGLLGPNGAGKTTTIKSILGLVVPTLGTVRIRGVDPHDRSHSVYRHVGAVLEGARNVYWRLTVRENLRYFAGLQGCNLGAARERHDELLEMLDLREKADQPVQNLSRGMKQKVSLACTLARETPVTFLDEPTLGLDVEASRELRNELARLAEDADRTIVLSSHDMDVIEALCDRVIILDDGRVVADDTVEKLVDLFRARAFRATVADVEPASLRRRLDDFDVYEWEPDGRTTTLEIRTSHHGEFYELVDTLESAGARVEAFSSTSPDLEEAFLAITNSKLAGVQEGSS